MPDNHQARTDPMEGSKNPKHRRVIGIILFVIIVGVIAVVAIGA